MAGTDDFITQVFLDARHSGLGARQNAGTFRVIGLGHVRSHGLNRPSGNRWAENVVMLPEDDINRDGCGRLLHMETDKDGSGVISVELDQLYSRPGYPQQGARERLYEHYGSVPCASAFRDSGITGLRSVAVDYSGLSGPPCLIAIADNTVGGRSKVWAWQLEIDVRPAGKASSHDEESRRMTWEGKKFEYRVGSVVKEERKRIEADPVARVEGKTFAITQGDANLRGTFIVPVKPTLEFGLRSRYTIGYKRGITKATSRAIFAEAGDSYFCVVTIQRGDPPPVAVLGKGLQRKAIVGKRIVSFHGREIVLAE